MKKIILGMTAVLSLMACSDGGRQNPFLTEWDTPYGIPPFADIQVEDYIPAIEAGIEQQNKEIDEIVSNQESPTFENTVLPLELSGEILSKVSGVLFNVSETDRTDELDSVMEKALPMLTEHGDNISFNKGLYERIAKLYHADQSQLNREQQMVLKKRFEAFERNGIGLSEEKQTRLREINTEMASKSQKLGNNILSESNAFKERFGISVSDYPNAMTTTEDRSLRREMLLAYTKRGNNGNEFDNRQLVLDIMRLRIEKAQIMGYKTPAAYILEPKMAHDAETVDAFLADIMEAAVAKAKGEVYDMQQLMNEDIEAGKLPVGSKIEPWDWWYYAEKVRKQKYDLNEELTKPYFKLENVLKGIFIAANTLYGLNVEELKDVPSYNSEVVTTYKITDADGSLLGIFTTDYLPRASKRGGAWMTEFRGQWKKNGVDTRPLISIVMNFTPSTPTNPSLLTFDEVQTLLHEFGHALHGLLSDVTYPSQSGTNVYRDFVELPSQLMENFADETSFLNHVAKHYQTGENIPEEMIQRIVDASNFNVAYACLRQLSFGLLDMAWYTRTEPFEGDVRIYEKTAWQSAQVLPEIEDTCMTVQFSHIMAGGYSAGYYSYKWAEVLDADAFSLFKEKGIFNKETANSFRENVLSQGGTVHPMVLYKNFRGKEPNINALLKRNGIKTEI